MLATVAVALAASPAAAFSVLAHQGVVDAAWQSDIVPLLRKRFPQASDAELNEARAYAYGGSHLADLGYFPLGSELFSGLLHYVRSGDFVAELMHEAKSPNDYAFALGAMAHYVADSIGHPQATNRAVASIYPKLARKHGDTVTYADSPSAHLQTEFRFDVFQVARRGEIPDLFEHAMGFQVPRPLLEHSFQAVYGLELGDLFTSYDVALGTYRWAFRSLIDEATGIAWQLYRGDIESLEPSVSADGFLRAPSRADFEKEFGNTYRQPGYFAKFVAFFGNLLPNVGPFKRLPYKPLPDDVKQLYLNAFREVVAAYRKDLGELGRSRLRLANVDLDTGRPSAAGEYTIADETYVELVSRLAKDDFAHASAALLGDLRRHFADRDAALAETSGRERRTVLEALSALDAAAGAAKR
ncbi:MAG TPA: zinc dependent phospholipase C family protein [Candidatus Binatia bacterium]|nr:zinc dependent phospholipase C family protein [Candidatus Binatia bacterium]